MASDDFNYSPPTTWRPSTLGELCKSGGGDIQTGPFGSQLHAADYVAEGVPAIMPTNIEVEGIQTDGIARITQRDAERLSKYRVRLGDIIYSRRGNVEKCAVVSAGESGWVCGTGCLRVRLGKAAVSPAFLHAYLSSPPIRSWLVRHAVGATMPNLNTTILAELPVSIPPHDEMECIGALWDSLLKKTNQLGAQNRTLEGIAQAIFNSWFVDFDPVRAKAEDRELEGMDVDTAALFPRDFEESEVGNIPRDWRIGSILSIANLLSGGTPKTEQAEYWGGLIDWASAKDVSQCRGTFLTHTERTITERGLAESSTKLIPAYSTAIVARGATTGRLALLGKTMAMNQTCYALTTTIDAPFALYCAIQNMVGQLLQSAHGSVFETITTSTFSGSRILLPPPSLLKAYENATRSLFRKVLANIELSNTLAGLRDTLLPRLISGKLRVPEAQKLIEAVV